MEPGSCDVCSNCKDVSAVTRDDGRVAALAAAPRGDSGGTSYDHA